MPYIQPPAATDVVSIDAARQRRRYIDFANTDSTWQQVKASFALEGIELTDDYALHIDRMITGDITYKQLVSELRAKHKQ